MSQCMENTKQEMKVTDVTKTSSVCYSVLEWIYVASPRVETEM